MDPGPLDSDGAFFKILQHKAVLHTGLCYDCFRYLLPIRLCTTPQKEGVEDKYPDRQTDTQTLRLIDRETFCQSFRVLRL